MATIEQTPNSTSVPTENLRSKLRLFAKNQRGSNREVVSDSLRFGLGDIREKIADLENLTVKDVVALAGRIKRRKHATTEDMFRLCHAFLQGAEYISAFANISGALQVLVKELTGSKFSEQISSCETLCNLSLGEPPVCEKIASIAGSYLITYMDSNDERLKRTSLWAIMNILSAGQNGAIILQSMEVFAKLFALYSNKNEEASIVEDAGKALCCYVSSARRTSDRDLLLSKLTEKKPETPGWQNYPRIIFEIGLISPEILLDDDKVQFLVQLVLYYFQPTAAPAKVGILFAVRILANLLAVHPKAADILSSGLKMLNLTISQVINNLFAKGLVKETSWLLNNILKCPNWADGQILKDIELNCSHL